MKKVLLFFITALVALTTAAMPARPGTFTVRQSDGTILTLRMVGDEHFHYYIDVNTGQRMMLAENGDYVVIPEQQFVHRQSAARQRMIQANSMRQERMERMRQMTAGNLSVEEVYATNRHKVVGNFNNNLKGQKKGLVILVNFADLEHSLADPQLEWDNAFNQVGYNKNGHIGSVHDYFYDQSYGAFDLEFDVVGPVTVSKKMSYYGQNNSYGSDAHAGEMVAEACKLVNSMVDFKDYDWDGDGEVDQVYVIYAGYGESSGAPAETIWPHEYWLEYGYGQKLHLDNVDINTYACSCELRGSGRGAPVMNGIGTACHEFSHCIGFPDFYDVDYSGCFGMDEWDVLGSGGYNGPTGSCEVPAGYTAYERWMAGWLEPIELDEGTEIKDMPCLLDEPVAYILRNKNKGTNSRPIDEYFLLENRQAKRWYRWPGLDNSGSQSAHGMLVSHINYDKQKWAQNVVNTKETQENVTIIPAGKTFGTYSSSRWYATPEEYRSMLFPGSRNVTELTNESHYECGGRLYNRNTDRSYTMGIPLTNITEKDGKLSYEVMGGKDLGYRWTVDFEVGEGSAEILSWKQEMYGEKIVLPEATPKYEGWYFFGWTTSEIQGSTQRPKVIIPAGQEYKPEDNVKLYAVYGISTDGSPLVEEYHLVDEVKDACKYMLVSKNAVSAVDIVAMDADKLVLNEVTKTPEGTVVDVLFDDTTPTIIGPAASLVWTARVNGELLDFTNGDNHLAIYSGGIALNDAPATLYYDSTYGIYGKTNADSNYYIHVSSGKFSVSTTKQKVSRVYLYQLSDFSDRDVYYTTYPSENINIEGVHATPIDRHDTSSVYDLFGRRVKRDAHGVFVVNGRKVVM